MIIATLALAATLSGLMPGATVTLGPGPYDLIEIKGASFDPPVTINAGTTHVHGLRIWNSNGIVWRGGVLSAPKGRDGVGANYYGADIRRSQNLTFDGVKVTEALRGMVVADTTGLVIRNAHFTGLRSDGLDVAGSSNVLLENNKFDDFAPVKATGSKADGTWKDGDHPDAIQLWTTPTNKRMTDITIRGNIVDGDTQGINFFGPRGDGYGHVTVENNDVRISYPAAISVFACDDCSVRNNRVAPRPDSKFHPNIRFEQSSGKLCGNIMPATPIHLGTPRC